MYKIQVIVILSFLGASFAAKRLPMKENSNVGLNVERIITKYGYPFESHTVQTSDGYLLTLHRIPYGVKNTETVRPPVLIMHGLLSNSADFVNMGSEKAISFLLADAGYDVWLGNSRGNTWSRKHISIDPNKEKSKFFNFTLHELGTLDLPAKIDYILNTTKQDNLFYIGHSQGTTISFILLSARPEYNAKIKMVAALAPVAYLKNAQTLSLKILDGKYKLLTELMTNYSFYEFLPHSTLLSMIAPIAFQSSLVREIFAACMSAMVGPDPAQSDEEFFPVMTTNDPAGVSIKQVLHFLQIRYNDRFAQFDNNFVENLNVSGETNTPLYNLSQITAPIMLHYSQNDYFAAVEDVQKLANEVSSAQLKLVPLPKFNHLDFIFAIDIVDLLNNDIIEEFNAQREYPKSSADKQIIYTVFSYLIIILVSIRL